ncbi:peptidyl-prolyl cis-trans isomerase [Pseudomonadota bacterium]
MKSAILPALLLSLLLAGCSDDKTAPTTIGADASDGTVLPGDDDVLVTVEGESITRYDLESAIGDMLSPEQGMFLDDAGRKKILESLIVSRVLAKKAIETGVDSELDALDKKVNAYKEQLLATHYLKAHVAPEPVTQEMVREYYEKHPEKFGGKTVREYEMLFEKEGSNKSQRASLLEEMQAATESKNWADYSTKRNKADSKLKLGYRSGELDVALFDKKLNALLMSLDVGETSTVTYIASRAYRVRITGERIVKPRPLQDVSAEIRKSLAPLQFKKSIKKISSEVLKTANVVYATNKE